MKKDYNHIAAVEKAISEKYGKDAAQDIRSQWDDKREKEYLEQLKKANHRRSKSEHKEEQIAENTYISARVDKRKDTRSCPVCKTYSFSMKDDLYMNRFSCCYLCYVDFIQDREERWESGWRPDQQRLAQVIKNRRK